MAKGQLRVYLGAAPGVGKTYKMLEEGHRRRDRGTDVVIGYVETHGRKHTEAMLSGLEVVPRKTIAYRGTTFEEMDVDAVLDRRPSVVLVDELAHTNIPGSRNAKRWQDIQELLDAGMTVITNLNIQHLESINDVVRQITGVPQRETVPDEMVRSAEQIELVDMTPEALRRRMAHGNIYQPEKIDAALGHYFRVGNLTALRELALLWLADKVDDELDRYRSQHDISAAWEARERVVVALTGGPEGDTLIRRAARVAARAKGADLLAVHVTRSDGLVGADPANLARQRTLVESLGGTYHQVVGTDVAEALLDFARGVNATELVLGVSRRHRWTQLLSRGVGLTAVRESGPIDVHLVTHEEVHRGRSHHRRSTSALSRTRKLYGYGLALVGLPLLTLVLSWMRADLTLPSDILLFLATVVVVALVGGLVPAIVAAVAASLLLNYFFTPPLHTFTIAEHENLLALCVFLAVAVAVSITVDMAARRTREAASARAEAETLSTLAGSVLRGARPLPALLDQLRETLGFTSVTLLERRPDARPGPDLWRDSHAWRVAAAVGDQPCANPGEGDAEILVDEQVSLVLRGHPLAAEDRRMAEAFAAQAAVALRHEQLAEEAAAAGPLAEADRLRTALLSAVSHDLRTPLASAKAAVGGLRGPVEFSAQDREELLATVEESLDRLNRLVDNLLDMSRLQAGALAMTPQPMSVAETVATALDDLGDEGRDIEVRVPDDLAEVYADPVLVERILVNVARNAIRYSPAERPPIITASELSDFVEIRVIDAGPGIPAEQWDRVFLPFQRLGDYDNETGVGLGLALSRGLAEAMGGSLDPEATPGGGLTMMLRLPQAEEVAAAELDAQVEAVAMESLDQWLEGERR